MGTKDIIQSGAKISPVDWAILMIAKGPTLNIEGEISKPITSSLIDGYTGEEYYDASAEARRTYYIRSQGTAEPGYLARQVTFSNANTTLGEEDCGTKKYLSLFVRGSILPVIKDRYYLNERTGKLVKITEDSKIVNKTIQLRSPLYCKSKNGICKTCYGDLSKKIESKHIGVIAGSVINESGIEGYSMKARHQATQVNVKQVDFTQDLIHI
jgi:DNA-directed RNA polymerase subunit beta'